MPSRISVRDTTSGISVIDDLLGEPGFGAPRMLPPGRDSREETRCQIAHRQFLRMIVMLVVPVCPVESRTVPVRVWVPFGTGVPPTGFVTHGMLTGPCDAVVCLVISLP